MGSFILPDFKLDYQVIENPRADNIPITIAISMFAPWVVDGETPVFATYSWARHIIRKCVV